MSHTLPTSAPHAVWRGAQGLCPSCGEASLFPHYLKPMLACEGCGQDWSPQQADDFPAYLAILVTGHLLAPIIGAVVLHVSMPGWALVTLILTSVVAVTMALLQPAKGAVIALQWWLGMHGFERPVPKS